LRSSAGMPVRLVGLYEDCGLVRVHELTEYRGVHDWRPDGAEPAGTCGFDNLDAPDQQWSELLLDPSVAAFAL
ncbi:hypothetical protein, partial [Nocardia farcinica]|uniref:hypothetical protein n=1 Tax=Nocardia farcinica TaxID=37329 RepID=UPI0034DB1D71